LPGTDPKIDLARRNALKILAFVGAAIPLIPLSLLAKVLLPPGESGAVKYPKLRIANSNDLGLDSSRVFEYPTKGRAALLIRFADGSFAAYDASCTHLGCQVHYNKSENFCPCHGGTFNARTGAVLAGPPPRPLPKIRLDYGPQGDIYADGYEAGLPLYGEG
jgi:Rieske Fe-S protein